MTSEEFRELALSFNGSMEAAHFDRRAFKCRRIFATLPADGGTANLRLTPDQQRFYCELYPDAFSPVPNKWGASGWTVVELRSLEAKELASAMRYAWVYGGGVE